MPSGKVAKPDITDNKDGTVTVRFAPTEAGLHEMDIRYENMHIPGEGEGGGQRGGALGGASLERRSPGSTVTPSHVPPCGRAAARILPWRCWGGVSAPP